MQERDVKTHRCAAQQQEGDLRTICLGVVNRLRRPGLLVGVCIADRETMASLADDPTAETGLISVF